METPRQDRDMGGRAMGAGRYDGREHEQRLRRFTREQLEGELAKVEGAARRRSSPFASSPEVEKQELSPRFKAELAKHEERQRRDAEQARRLGNE